MLAALGLAVILILSVLYVFQINSLINQRQVIKKSERMLEEMMAENKNLVIVSAQKNSLDKLAVLLDELNFEKAEKVHYIKVLNNKVVAK